MNDEAMKVPHLVNREPQFEQLGKLLSLPPVELFQTRTWQNGYKKESYNRYGNEVIPLLVRLMKSKNGKVRQETGKVFVEQLEKTRTEKEGKQLFGQLLWLTVEEGKGPDMIANAMQTLEEVVEKSSPLDADYLSEFSSLLGHMSVRRPEDRSLLPRIFHLALGAEKKALHAYMQPPESANQFEEPSETWQTVFVSALRSPEIPYADLFKGPDLVTSDLEETQTPLRIMEEVLSAGKPDGDLSRLQRNIAVKEFGIGISTESGRAQVNLQPINLIDLRKYRYDKGEKQYMVIESHARGNLYEQDILKHVAYLDEEKFAANLESLRTKNIFGDPAPTTPTYLQWADSNATTYGQLHEGRRKVTLLVDPYRLGQSRNGFIDPESLLPEFSSTNADGGVLEHPGDLVMVYGGIPKSAIVGVSFEQQAGKLPRVQDYFINPKSILENI